MDARLQDFRYAIRSLRKARAFTVAAVLTLALGVGANTAIFSVVYGVLLRPLPYREPSRLVRMTAQGFYAGVWRQANYSGVELPLWRARVRSFESLASYAATAHALYQKGNTSSVSGSYVSADFFHVVGGSLSLGRFFDQHDSHSPVAVISHRLWQREFSADPGILGQALSLDDTSFTVVGVAAPSFALPYETTDVWTPVDFVQTLNVSWVKNPNGGGFNFVGRLKPDVTVAQAQQDAADAAVALMADSPSIAKNRRPVVQTMTNYVVGDVRSSLTVLLVAVSFVLLVACINVTNLYITRNLSRSRELAIMAAMGASRRRLLSRSFAEVAVLGAGGCLAALFVARGVVATLIAIQPQQLPRLSSIQLDGPVFVFALAVALIIIAAITLLSAASIATRNPYSDLKAGSGLVTGGLRARRLRAALVVVELATSFTLIVCALLLGRSLTALLRTDVGVATDHTLTAFLDLNLGRAASSAIGGANEVSRVNRIIEQVGFIPGVRAAGLATSLPPTLSRMRVSFALPSAADGVEKDYLADLVPITSTYFRTVGVPLLRGRGFADADNAASPQVAIVSASTARALFGDGEAVGRQLPAGLEGDPIAIVGVVADVKYSGLAAAAPLTVYVPYSQRPFRAVHLFVRVDGDPVAVTPNIRRAVASVDPRIAIVEVRPLADVVSAATAQPRLRTIIFVALASLALLLAAVGLSGVVAYSVSQQTREIGIRIALGASAPDVVRMVLTNATRLSVAGVALGAVSAYGTTRILSSMVYGVTTHDPWSFAGACVVLLGIAFIASYAPARRAARVDPVIALKAE